MTYLFPSSTLSFDSLLNAIGEDPEPLPADPVAIVDLTKERVARWECARHIYEGNSEQRDAWHRLANEFVSCFGVFHQSSLFKPLEDLWRAGHWNDFGFAAFLRALMVQGGHTSAILDELAVSDLTNTLSMLPREALMSSDELTVLDRLSEIVIVYRGGWAERSEELIGRGVSWTLDDEVGAGFIDGNIASSSPGQRPIFLKALVKKEHIAAYFREEYEVIINPMHVSQYEVMRTPRVKRFEERAREMIAHLPLIAT